MLFLLYFVLVYYFARFTLGTRNFVFKENIYFCCYCFCYCYCFCCHCYCCSCMVVFSYPFLCCEISAINLRTRRRRRLRTKYGTWFLALLHCFFSLFLVLLLMLLWCSCIKPLAAIKINKHEYITCFEPSCLRIKNKKWRTTY